MTWCHFKTSDTVLFQPCRWWLLVPPKRQSIYVVKPYSVTFQTNVIFKAFFALIGSNDGRNVVTYDCHNLYCNERCLVPCLFSSMKDT